MFTAQLLSGSDKEITVSPNSGELTPVNTKGTLFCVTYKPTTYGRNHHAKLVVQVSILGDIFLLQHIYNAFCNVYVRVV